MKPLTKITALVGTATVGFLIFAWDHAAILPLRAVVSDASSALHEIPVKKEEKSAFVAVLTRYGERYEEREDGIRITPRLYFDQQLRWNYTSKK